MTSGLNDLRMVARQQGGLFSLGQATSVGIPVRTLEHWRTTGWLEAVRRGVYAFAGAPASRWRPSVAAALAAGSDAVLSHRTAGAIHGFHGLALPANPELILPRAPRRRLEGAELHFTGPVDDRDQVIRRGVAVTTPVRTLIDLASCVEAGLLGQILDEGAVRRAWSFEEVDACLRRQPRGRTGGPRLRHLLSLRLGEATPDSRLEQRVIRYLRPLRPFEVHFQLVLDGTVVVLDVAWPAWRIAAEIDGRSYRQISRSAHDRESRKLTLLAAADWKVAHLTATMTASECVSAVMSLLFADSQPVPSY